MAQTLMKVERRIQVEVPGLGDRIQEARRKDKRSLTALAAAAEMTTAYWYSIEKEDVKALPEETLRKLEEVLGVNFSVEF